MTAIAYPNAPTFPGVTFRPAVLPDDLPAMNRLANAVRAAEGVEWVTSDEQFAEYYEHLHNCDPATDIMVGERDGRMVAYGRASWREDQQGRLIYEPTVFTAVEEGAGLLDAVTEAMEARCREMAAGHPPGDKFIEIEGVDSATTRLQLLRARGYEPARYYFQMVRPNLDDLPDAPLPAGLDIRPVKTGQLRAIFDAEAEAMSDEWGFAVPTEADYDHFVSDPVHGDRSLWQVAWDGDQIAGMVRGYINEAENEVHRRRRGWVENISVRRPWRRRGLARALIAATIAALRERGMTEGALGVDSDSPSGALRLYESCGFQVHRREAAYRKPL